MKKLYKTFSVFLLAIASLFLVGAVYTQVSQTVKSFFMWGWGRSVVGDFFDIFIEGFLPGLIVLTLAYVPAVTYWRYSKTLQEGRLIKWAFWFQMVSFLIFAPVTYLLLGCYFIRTPNYCDFFLFAVGPFLFAIPALILYGLGIVLLIINKIINKPILFNGRDKVAAWVLAFSFLLIGIIYAIALYLFKFVLL